MSNPTVIETVAILTSVVDCVVSVEKRNGLTTIVLAETRKSAYDGREERNVTARLAIPDPLVGLIARTILAGQFSSQNWIMDDEPDQLGLRRPQ